MMMMMMITLCVCIPFVARQSVDESAGSIRHKNCPVSLNPYARDAYLLFQVHCTFVF